ncbi:GNAT family N-acetyltransferase [Coralloluteibacterium stylophorae]|uniref:GNAT family N-acetyltransferase n=1 Tax=Coralloluteibacterium stylophorae TaxID=1776034 RepID=A0A8J7VSC8_9GAMM|nr:GNAT family N-acetyltransferase [Coralloluteibacterium stylophorae]MBS7458686.1 GNAT family N-acetyltransferase [Coralloluteibacterium stylophorae]
MDDSLHVRALTGEAVGPWLDDLARLRIAVFADFPYLYAGDVGYERRYLETYTRSPESLFVLALDGDRVVGASTGIPLADETEAFRTPFAARGIDPARVFYFGESVLLREWRGRGLGHRFFDEREGYARRLGRFDTTAFCAVDRAADDPRRPAGHRDNDAFWRKRGYTRQDGMQATLSWAEHGETAETPKTLTFWTRPLEQAR